MWVEYICSNAAKSITFGVDYVELELGSYGPIGFCPSPSECQWHVPTTVLCPW